jgi:Flp pilus assembly protein TadD
VSSTFERHASSATARRNEAAGDVGELAGILATVSDARKIARQREDACKVLTTELKLLPPAQTVECQSRHDPPMQCRDTRAVTIIFPRSQSAGKDRAMSKRLEFHFTVSKASEAELMSPEEAEAALLQRLEERGGACSDTLWDLARLYSLTGRQQLALRYTQRLVSGTDDLEKLAAAYLAQGQLMEQMSDWKGAIVFYERAFTLQPTNPATSYLVHNNLGYCLNQIGRYQGGEGYCRTAIAIDPRRANAFKNLGLSLVGQARYAAAAQSFIDAVKADASDPRAARHLEDLVAEHRAEVEAEIPDLDDQLREVRRACEVASRVNEAFQTKPKM